MTRGLRVVLANLAPLALMWIIGFVLMRINERFSAPPTLKEAGILFGIVVGAGLAWKLRARVALLIAHLYYRVDRVNGGPVQMAILLASVLGVIVGSVINRGRVSAAAA